MGRIRWIYWELIMAGTLTEEQYQQQQLNRQQKMAELLMAQGSQGQPAGQMVSGRYVPNSWAQNLLPAAQMITGAYLAKKGDEASLKLAEQLRGKEAQAVQDYMAALNPAQTELAGPTPTNEPLMTQNQPDYGKAFTAATSRYAPAPLQAAGYKMLEPITTKEGEKVIQRNLAGGGFSTIAEGAPKKTTEERQYDLAQSQGFKGSFMDYQTLLKQAGATNLNVNTGQHGFDNALKLRQDFRSEPVYKGFEEIRAAKNQIDQAAKMASPAGDLAAATKIMKILDPGSVVRESELGMAMAATGVEDRVRNYANMVITGEKLTPAQRKDFIDLSDKLYNVAGQQFNVKRQEYAGIAERNKLDVQAAVGAPATINQGGWRIK